MVLDLCRMQDGIKCMTEQYMIQKAAVLGAGVMGAQIAAHLANAGISTILFDLPSQKGDHNAIAKDSLQALKKLKPLPLGMEGIENTILPANYNTDLDKLTECDLVIEVIAERMEYKLDLYKKVTPFLSPRVIFATNTSGLSITELAKALPVALQKRFCGIHFFNPPRYMKLIELIPHAGTELSLLTLLETFLVSCLGKGVVHAKDTPNFIGNRIGVFAFLAALHHSQELGLMPDTVDALTGSLIGRPKSATFRTMDVVGLDTMSHVVNTLRKELPNDPWNAFFTLPVWIKELIERGALGQKTHLGLYKKVGSQIQVYDYHDACYREMHGTVDPEVLNILKNPDPKTRFLKLSQSTNPQGQFLWRIFRDLFHYCAYHLKDIAHTVRDIDLAMRWGYGFAQGPFETWQLAGWNAIAQKISQEIKEGQTLCSESLPEWVLEKSFEGPYKSGTAFSPLTQSFESRSDLPVYKRQIFPDPMLTDIIDEGETIFETADVRMWTKADNIPILSFKTKKNSITVGVLEGIQEAIARAEKDYDALILWQRHDTDFSVGASLPHIVQAVKENRIDLLDKTVSAFQHTALALRYAKVPTIAAISGLTLGGGCELSMHATKRVAAFETYMGLVEVGVGLLPAGAGSKELALRAAERAIDGDIFNALKAYFQQITTGQVSASALDAKRLHYLRNDDLIVMNTQEVLYMAKKQARALADMTYTPPLAPHFRVAGKTGIANFQTALVNMREGEFISDHEYKMGTKIAEVLCGGQIEAGSIVDENWMLHLEKEGIMELIQTQQTLERIQYMLEKGKPLRN